MANYDLNTFQKMLEARIAELQRGMGKRDHIAVEQSADEVEEMQRASEVALAICHIDRESNDLRNARAALRRIQNGSFGICEECEEEIHPKRLRAIPWAALCIHCQESWDSTRPTVSTDLSGLNAA